MIGRERDPWFQATPEALQIDASQIQIKRRFFGQGNPELVEDQFILQMVANLSTPDGLRMQLDPECWAKDSNPAHAIWTFNRFGASVTLSPGEDLIYIGGEFHEICSQIDSHVYNDVVVRDRLGRYRVYRYPLDAFPPVQSHSATLVGVEPGYMPGVWEGGAILIIGGTGHEQSQEWWATPIHKLDLYSFEIHPVQATGDKPGFVHGHSAALLSPNELMIWGGRRMNESQAEIPNSHMFVLNLESMVWSRHRLI